MAHRRSRTWAVTAVATVASTYALDAVAGATGIALAASGLLSGVDHRALVVFLIATYAVWGLGLRANLAANWSLLEQTGSSTSIVSKAFHDVTAARTGSVRRRRLAAAAGYLGAEIAKELPYYSGAFAATLSDSVTSDDALVFLGGANLGAAVYEYGVARMTRIFLRRRSA